jgi:hypothetical protein
MESLNYQNSNNLNNNIKIWFFAGAETRDDKFNIFTGSYIRLMREILGDKFEHVNGVCYNSSARNVIWALNNAQKPVTDPTNERIVSAAFRKIVLGIPSPDISVTITSSSSGSIVAAQTACYLALQNKGKKYLNGSFNLVLGASMLSEKSELFRTLKNYQNEGLIGKIIHDEVLDSDDSANGVGGETRGEAYKNAFGLMLPLFSKKYSWPSFLNTHPEKGHVHRKRSKTVKKALDYIDVILIRHQLAGENYKNIAIEVVKNTIGNSE